MDHSSGNKSLRRDNSHMRQHRALGIYSVRRVAIRLAHVFLTATALCVSVNSQSADVAADANSANRAGRPVALDLVGIQLGISAEAALDTMKPYAANYKIESRQVEDAVLSSTPIIDGLTAVARAGRERISLEFTLPPDQVLVWAIDRYIGFDTGKEPLKKTVLQALRTKYGQESAVEPASEVYLWVFDDNGKPLGGDSYYALSNCSEERAPRSALGRDVLRDGWSKARGTEQCNRYLKVQILLTGASRELGLVGAVSARLCDVGLSWQSSEATRAHLVQTMKNAEASKTQEAAKQRAPKF